MINTPRLDSQPSRLLSFFKELGAQINIYQKFLRRYFFKHAYREFAKFERIKDFLATSLYRQRGRFAGPFIHTGMMMLLAFSIMITPIIADSTKSQAAEDITPQVYSPFDDPQTQTNISDYKLRDKVITYTVEPGDTLSSIAKKFDISVDTIRWQNKLESANQIKPGQNIEILPISGISHKVQKGDTIYGIAKKYSLDSAQSIVDYPFNSFADDETFGLAVGQTIIVPDGVMPSQRPWSPSSSIAQRTPNAGAVTASGQFVWPTNGIISQRYSWFHKGIDIANRAAPGIVAADSGTVIVAGWPDNTGYGNRIVIDHKNGYHTLYGHLSKIYVSAGQTVKRGDQIGQMGSTGRSTGTHLHFEIRSSNGNLNPLNFLK